MHRKIMVRNEVIMKTIIVLFSLILIFTASCSELTNVFEQVSIKKPAAKINDIALQKVNLSQATIALNVQISNPNPVNIKLAGFDYDLKIEDNSFVSGNKTDQLSIEAQGTNSIKFPLTLNYKALFNMYNDLKNNDAIDYTIDLGLNVNLPVLGTVRIPVSKSDKLPIMKTPHIQLNALNLTDMSLTKANFVMALKIDNPNKWSLDLNRLSYTLEINNRSWIDGRIPEKINLAGKETSLLKIPFTLNYFDVGKSVYSLIKSERNINYQINGNADIGSSISFLENFDFPYQRSGVIKLTK